MSKLEECLKRYWELIVQENYPKTPEITKELDALEEFIKSANATRTSNSDTKANSAKRR